MTTNDIDDFIRAQKSKIKQERQALQGIQTQPAGDPLNNRPIQKPAPVTGGPKPQIQVPGSTIINGQRDAFAPALSPKQYPVIPPRQPQTVLDRQPAPASLGINYQAPSIRNPQLVSPRQAAFPAPQAVPQVEVSAEKPLVEKMGEYENRRQRINDERREEYQRLAAIESLRPTRRRTNSEGAADEQGASLPGIKDHGSAKTRKEQMRNQEYQEFKRIEEEKFRNRMAHKKPPHAAATQPKAPPQQSSVQPAIAPQEIAEQDRSPRPRRNRLLEGINTFGELEKWQDLLVSQPPPDNNVSRRQRENRLDRLERELLNLRQEGFRPRPRLTDAQPRPQRIQSDDQLFTRPSEPRNDPDLGGGSLQGLSDRLSEAAKLRDERNREYNQHLQEKAERDRTLRAGRFMDDSPRYDDNLTKRRYEDTLRQVLNEPGAQQRAPEPRSQPARRKPRGAFVNADLEKLDSLDNEYAVAKTNLYRRDRSLSPPAFADKDDDLAQLRGGDSLSRRPPRAPARQGARDTGRRGPPAEKPEDGVLPIGRNETDSAQKRKKDAYRLELERQIQETKERNRLAREEERKAPQAPLARSRSYNDIIGQRELSKPRAATLFGDIDNGDIGTSLNKSSLVTSDLDHLAGGQPGLTPYTTPADDAYHYYGMKNPLEAAGYGEDSLLAELGSDVLAPSRGNRQGYQAGADGAPTVKTGRVRFDEPEVNGMTFRSQDDISNVKKQRQKEYAMVLQQQIVENQKRKAQARAEQEAYDKKFENEVNNYDPFGRGGGGAPVKDAEGNVQADLRGVLADTGTARQKQQPTPRREAPPDPGVLRLNLSRSAGLADERETAPLSAAKSPRSARRQTNALGEATHARGGHGIFGQPLTDEQLQSRHRFREDLAVQIEEKRLARERERERERREEEEEIRRIEQERVKMREEEEEERRRRAEKEEETRKKNEEVLLRQKREEDEERRREVERDRIAAERERDRNRAPPADDQEVAGGPATDRWVEPRRTDSPPVPALYNAMKKDGQAPAGTPPRSARTPRSRGSARNHPPPSIGGRAPEAAQPKPGPELGSNHALRDLRRMKQQLNSERERVERALMQQHYSVEVHDPRLAPAPVPALAPAPVAVVRRNPDAFESARERQKPVPVRRRASRSDLPDERQLRDFTAVKADDSAAGRQVRELHPATPLSARQLEEQQRAYLREQEDRLRRLQLNAFSGSPYAADMPGMAPADLGLTTQRTGSPEGGQPLQAETAFIGLNGAPFRSSENPWAAPADPPLAGDLSDRRDTDRGFSPDYFTRKNEERLRNLRAMERENAELTFNNDSEEVLARFMEKQNRNSSSHSYSRPRPGPPRAPSSGLAGVPNRTYAFLDEPSTNGALDPVHESALDGPLEPDPVNTMSSRDAAVARADPNPNAKVDLPYKDGPTPLDDTWLQSSY